jgi:predicted TIM-barrel fold metal-dependent hydrolase
MALLRPSPSSRIIPTQEAWNQTASDDGIFNQRVRLNKAWYYIEDYLSQSQGFQSQAASLICEGVFAKHPGLKVVLIESGVTWIPEFLWRLAKLWRGLRTEVPWIERSPREIFRDHFRATIQPFDAPDSPDLVRRVIDHLGSDELLLFSTDYPHWQLDGDDVLPAGIRATYFQGAP